MKTRILLLFFLITLIGCHDDEKIPLLKEQSFQLDSDEHLLRIGIRAGAEWQVTGDSVWCKIRQVSGDRMDSLLVHVAVNLLESPRETVLRVSDGSEVGEIQIRQAGATGEYHYRLPVIFHILCYGIVMVDKHLEDRLLFALEKTNEIYQGNHGKSIDMNLEFYPVTHDPEGKVLKRAGINWRAHKEVEINYQDFIDNKYGDIDWVWNTNEYINIYVYNFYDNSIYGVSILPFTPVNHALEGLPTNDQYYFELPVSEIQCVLINRETFNDTIPTPLGNQDRGVITLTHELGHYLGLLHAFSNGGEVETDYCEDTPDYSRSAYGSWRMNHPDASWYEKVQRTDRDNNVFTARNMMDYWDCYFDQFTPDQRKRVRHVLTYSPLIPGPKIPVKLSPESKSGGEKRRVIIH